MTPDTEGAPERRAALTMHALCAVDRAWVLAALPAAHRNRLGPMLAELEGLGIPRDPSLVAEAATPAASPAPARPTPWPGTLDDAGVVALARVLELEPPGLTVTLLSMRAWTWAPQLLAALDGERGARVRVLPTTRAPARRLHEAILEALRSRVEAEVAAQVESVPPPDKPWRRFLARIGRRA